MVIYGDPSYKIKATTNSLINFAVQAALAIRGFGYRGFCLLAGFKNLE